MIPFRIGIFGGTFDPVHLGHLHLANLAIEEIGLSRLVFIPALQPPHKNGVITPFEQRIAMVQLVCQDDDSLQCSSIEGELPKPSYTIDTLVELKKRYSNATELYFIIGADAFLDFLTWKSYSTILSTVEIVLSKRVGYPEERLYSFLNSIGYTYKNGRWVGENERKDIIILSESPQDICSSKVREVIARGGEVTNLLPPKVINYIIENRLYSQ